MSVNMKVQRSALPEDPDLEAIAAGRLGAGIGGFVPIAPAAPETRRHYQPILARPPTSCTRNKGTNMNTKNTTATTTSTTNQINNNTLTNRNQSKSSNPTITIRTSRNWVLPPRPKPGRKPYTAQKKRKSVDKSRKYDTEKRKERKKSKDSKSKTKKSSSSTRKKSSSISKVTSKPAQKSCTHPGNMMMNQQSCQANQQGCDFKPPFMEVDASLVENPIKREILRVNEENYYMKLEVIRQVAVLKNMHVGNSTVTPTRKNYHSGVLKHARSLELPSKRMATTPASEATTPHEYKQRHLKRAMSVPTTTTTTKTTKMTTANTRKSQNRIKRSQSCVKSNEKRGKKRSRDSDINDLIVSLVDLSHAETYGINDDGNETPTSRQNSTPIGLQRSPTGSMDDDGASTISTTPSTMLTSIKTSDTLDSMSGTTIVSINSPQFKLLDIPEVDLGGKVKREECDDLSLLDIPSSFVDESGLGMDLATTDSKNIKKKPTTTTKTTNTHDMSDEFYDFDGPEDVEMEFENFVNGNDMEMGA